MRAFSASLACIASLALSSYLILHEHAALGGVALILSILGKWGYEKGGES